MIRYSQPVNKNSKALKDDNEEVKTDEKKLEEREEDE